jgi:hypothetical protein
LGICADSSKTYDCCNCSNYSCLSVRRDAVLGRLHSSYVLSTKIGLHRIELINKTLVNDDILIFLKNFSLFMLKVISSENFSFQSYQNKNL